MKNKKKYNIIYLAKKLAIKFGYWYKDFYFKRIDEGKEIFSELSDDKYWIGSEKDYQHSPAEKLRSIRFVNVWHSIVNSPAITFPFALSIITFFTSIFVLAVSIFMWWAHDSRLDISIIIAGAVALLTTGITFYLSPLYFYSYVKNLDLQQYGHFFKSHLTESEMLSYISFRIWNMCNEMEKKTKFLISNGLLIDTAKHRNLFGSDYEVGSLEIVWTKNSDRIATIESCAQNVLTETNKIHSEESSDWWTLISHLKTVEQEVEKINILVHYFSQKTHISYIELTEHIFQFSPSLFLRYSRKLITNLTDVANIESNQKNIPTEYTFVLKDRQRALLYESYRFINRLSKFKKYQKQNISYSDCHQYLLLLASTSSSSEAFKCYSKLLHKISQSYSADCGQVTTSSVELDQPQIEHLNRLKTHYLERLRYVFHKRFAYGAIDLHFSYSNTLQKLEDNGILKSLADARQMLSLDIFKLYLECTEKTRMYMEANAKDRNELEQDEDIQQAIQNNDAIKSRIEYINGNDKAIFDINEACNMMLNAPKYIKAYLELSRRKMQNKLYSENIWKGESFNSLIEKWNKQGCDIYLITLGYSRAVREFLKNYNKTFNSEYKGRNKHVIFFAEEESTLDSRLIKYSLTEDSLSKFNNIVVSKNEFIAPLLNEKSRIIILMGAEAVDDQYRVVRTYNYKNELVEFIKEARSKILNGKYLIEQNTEILLNQKHIDKITANSASYTEEDQQKLRTLRDFHEEFYKCCRTIVLCESYKKHEDITKITQHFDDQYEDIECYESSLISAIFTDES